MENQINASLDRLIKTVNTEVTAILMYVEEHHDSMSRDELRTCWNRQVNLIQTMNVSIMRGYDMSEEEATYWDATTTNMWEAAHSVRSYFA